VRKLALATLRERKGSFLAAFVTLLCAAALVAACGGLLESGIRGDVATERYAGAGTIIAADQLVTVTTTSGDKTKVKSKQLTQHEWVDSSLVDSLREVPGAHDAVGELTFGASVLGPEGTPCPRRRTASPSGTAGEAPASSPSRWWTVPLPRTTARSCSTPALRL